MKRRPSGVWLTLFSWLLASEFVSACDDVRGRAIIPAPDETPGGSGGGGGANASGGEAVGGDGGGGIAGGGSPEGGAAATPSSGGSMATGGAITTGGASSGGPGVGGTATGGVGGGNAGTFATGGSSGQPPCPTEQVGFATAGGGGVTGGLGGTVVKASTAAQLRTHAMKDEPLIIQIDSRITLTEQIRPKSDKTILGVGTNAELTGGGLYVLDVHNVIVQNLKISNAPEDAISIQNSQHVWVDHCDLSSNLTEPKGTYDDLLAVTHGADYVTVSWTYFHDHYAVSLVGHSSDSSAAAEDIGHLTVTYHHNWFSNMQSNTPRVRFGSVHLFNNLFQSISANAVISQMGAQVVVERNAFKNVLVPITTQYEDPEEGMATDQENLFSADSGPNQITLPATWLPRSSYYYEADSTESVEFLVSACAGVGKL